MTNPETIKKDGIPFWVRSGGLRISAGRGTGKSRLMGRAIAFPDFMSEIPLILFDPQGPLIDNFLDKLMRLPPERQHQVRDRLVYLDMTGRTEPRPRFPLYYQLPRDTLHQVAMRLPETFHRLDPALDIAPVRGWNAIETIGVSVGMVLHSLGLPISFAPSLLTNPASWEASLRSLSGEAAPAADYFLNIYPKSRDERQKADVFLAKIRPFTHDPIMKEMFATTDQTINWGEVVARKQAVIIDLRGERDPRFKILWVLNTFLEYIKLRGHNRDQPVSLIIDELAYLLALNSQGRDLLTADLDDLINIKSRNSNLWLTLAHQEPYQFSPQIQKTLMSMGTQIIGYTTDIKAAEMFADRFFRYEPYLKKSHQIRFAGDQIDYFSVQEQRRFYIEEFMKVRPHSVKISIPITEGTVSSGYKELDLKELDYGEYPDDALIKPVRERLAMLTVLRAGVAPTRLPPPEEPPAPMPMPSPVPTPPPAAPAAIVQAEFLPDNSPPLFAPPKKTGRKKKTSNS